MLILKLLGTLVIGLASHLLHKPTRKLGPKAGPLSRYAIGILLFIPLTVLVKSSLPKKAGETFWESVERDLVAGLLTAGAQGSGTFIAYALDSHDEEP